MNMSWDGYINLFHRYSQFELARQKKTCNKSLFFQMPIIYIRASLSLPYQSNIFILVFAQKLSTLQIL